MIRAATPDEFRRIYKETLEQLMSHWTPEMQRIIARHNTAWQPGQTDFRRYLELSEVRYYKAYLAACKLIPTEDCPVCDVGGFWGIFPVAMARLGFTNVSMTESIKYYGAAFKELFREIEANSVEVIDFDPFEEVYELPKRYSFLSVMAVIEHYPHSLRAFMDSLTRMLDSQGRLYIEVPNIAYLPKRLALMRGGSPLASLESVWHSEVPFVGHHREFTEEELLRLMELGGWTTECIEHYRYSDSFPQWWKDAIRHPLWFAFYALTYRYAPTTRECIALVARKR